MEYTSETFGHRTNELARQRLQQFKGSAIIDFKYLTFHHQSMIGTRLRSSKNLERLIKVFEIEGCANLEPEHRIVAITSSVALNDALCRGNLSQAALLDPTRLERLVFDEGYKLTIINGRHRVLAGQKVGKTEWLVDMYPDDLPTEVLTQLQEESLKSLDFTDGEIYRNIRFYQVEQNIQQESKWWARLGSEGRRKDFRRLQRNKPLLDGFDKLLPYIGLWRPLKSSQIERMLALKCPEILVHYLNDIHQKWSSIFPDSECFADPDSIEAVEGLIPQLSIHDREHLTQLIKSNLEIFQLVTGAQRDELLCRLLRIPGRLTSINTLIQDTLFLEGPAKALQRLCPPKFKGSLYRAMRYQWDSIENGRHFEVQISERTFLEKEPSSSHFHGYMMQLWFFGLRHFVHNVHITNPKKSFGWSNKMLSLVRLAMLAQRMGFSSPRIIDLLAEGANKRLARGFVETICRDEFYNPRSQVVRDLSTGFDVVLQSLQDITYMSIPQLTTEDPDQKAHRRFNSPVPEQYISLRRNLFLNQFSEETPCSGRFPTSFGITRDILLCFFGSESLRYISDDQHPAESPSAEQIQSIYAEQNTGSQDIQPRDITPPGGSVQVAEAGQTDQNLQIQSGGVETPSLPSQPQEVDPTALERSDLEHAPHPTGTPDYDKPESEHPLAPGFEDIRHNGSLNFPNHIIHRRRIEEILQIWFDSKNETLVVLFLFESRTYFKFLIGDVFNIRGTLMDRSKQYSFQVIDPEYGLITPDLNKILEVALEKRLVLAARRDRPGPPQAGEMTLDLLRDYIKVYDVHTGKRKMNAESLAPNPKRRYSREEES